MKFTVMSLFFGRFLSVLALTTFISIPLKAQSIKQTVRVKIVDRESSNLLKGAGAVAIESDLTIDNERARSRAGAFIIQEDSWYDSLFNYPSLMFSGYATGDTTRGVDPGVKKNTLPETSSLNYAFSAKHNLKTDYLFSDGPAFQNNFFIKNTSVKPGACRRAVIAPALLIAAGVSTLDEDNDDDGEIQAERNRHIPNFRHHVDDYLQHSPILVVYGLNWLGVKGKNDFANRTAILIKSEAMVGILTFSLKRMTAVPRPDTGERTSFPSGHTAQAFAAATFMAKEYGHKSVWYSIGAYTVATGVGAMRIMNNRHWMSDVLVGAGIGILSTNLVYLTHQYRWGKKNKGGQTIVVPSYDGQAGMVSIIHRIN